MDLAAQCVLISRHVVFDFSLCLAAASFYYHLRVS
jgi:hypothetical protein